MGIQMYIIYLTFTLLRMYHQNYFSFGDLLSHIESYFFLNSRFKMKM